jgi:hypothetical protein
MVSRGFVGTLRQSLYTTYVGLETGEERSQFILRFNLLISILLHTPIPDITVYNCFTVASPRRPQILAETRLLIFLLRQGDRAHSFYWEAHLRCLALCHFLSHLGGNLSPSLFSIGLRIMKIKPSILLLTEISEEIA